MRGERGLGRKLTPAPASAFAIATSLGEKLAAPLRADLESSFDASLDAVRIHRDAAAGFATRQLGAEAFASGTHIYFAPGRFAPHADAGRELIAHEVAHVLQQSVRASSGNRRAASDVRGAGEVQRWASPLPSSVEDRTDVQLMAEHLAAAISSAADSRVIARFMAECAAPGTGGPAYWATRAIFVMSGAMDPVLGDTPQAVSAPVASALYDGLKISGQFIAAAKLLHDRDDLRTLFFSAETYERYTVDYGAELTEMKPRLYREWNTAAWFGNATPRFMLDRVAVYLLGPSASNTPSHARDGDVVDMANAELLRRHAGTLGPVEFHYIAVLVAAQLDLLRQAFLTEARDFVVSNPAYDQHDHGSFKLYVARAVRQMGRNIINQRSTLIAAITPGPAARPSLEALYIWIDDLVPAIIDIADYAIDFQEFSAQVNVALASGEAIAGTDVLPREVLANIDRDLPGYRAKLEEFLHAVLDRNANGSIPEPAEFGRRRDAAVRALDRNMFRLVERPMVDRLFDAYPRRSDPTLGFDFDRAVADRVLPTSSRVLNVWALATANDLRKRATREFTRPRDTLLAKRQRTVDAAAPATDLREIFRVRVAEYALMTAQSAGWTGWAEWVRPIVEGGELRRAGDTAATDYIAFGSDWTLDDTASVSALATDLPGQIENMEPLTTPALVEFYLAEQYDAVTRHIDSLLDTNRGNYTLGDDPVINRAFTAARAEAHPERYLIRDWEWVTQVGLNADGQMDRVTRTDVRRLILDHPLTRALMRDIDARSTVEMTGAVTATRIDNQQVAVYWALPTPAGLISRIQLMPEVSQLILDALPILVAQLGSLLDPASTLTAQERTALQELVTRIESGAGFDTSIGTPPPATPMSGLSLDALMALDWEVWWSLWRAVLAVQSGARQSGLIDDIRRTLLDLDLTGDLHYERTVAADLAMSAQRRALAHERRRRIEVQIRPELAAFDAYSEDQHRVPGTSERVRERDLVMDASHRLTQFIYGLEEIEEREGHLAMAVLELSDTLSAQIGTRRTRGDITAWVPYLDAALVWANHPDRGVNATYRDGFTVAEERGDSALFARRRAATETLLTHMAEVLQEDMSEYGIVGRTGDGTIENPGGARGVGEAEGRAVTRGQPFTIDGRTWEIMEVRANFIFHPGVFELRSMRNRSVAGSKLYIGNSEEPADHEFLDEGSRPHTLLMRVMVDEGPEVIDVYADDDPDLLRQLTWALHMHATLEQLGELGAAIEGFGGLMMDAAELFPGAGQALAAARLVSTAMAFFAGEGPAMIAELVTNPRALLNALLSRLNGLMSVDNVIGFMLFSNASFSGLIREPRATGGRGLRGHSSSRLRRLLLKVQSLARSVGRVFVRVQDGVQDKRQSVEHMVQNSPGMVRLVQIIADYYLMIMTLRDHLGDISDLPTAIGDFRANVANFPQMIDETIARMGEMQLPEDILPRRELVSVLIDVIGHKLGGKYKLGVRILFELLDFIGAREQIEEAIAKLLKDAGVTTANLFPMWTNEIVPAVEGKLQDAQRALQGSLNRAFNEFGVPIGLERPSANVETSGTEFPEDSHEAAPMLREDVGGGFDEQMGGGMSGSEAGRLLDSIAGESGEPMDAALRASAEGRFGEDFSHVRVHRGTRAESLTDSLGANALTSGSHVILAAGDAGDGALFHELAHVVQQTGSRPAGRGPRAPRLGRARRGVRIDPRAEAAADAAAAAAASGRLPAAALSGPADGWQPDFEVELYGQRFLRQLVDVSAIEAETARIDETNATTGRRLIGADVRRAVRGVEANLRALFRNPGATGLAIAATGPFHDARDAISLHLQGSMTDIGEAIEDIAIRASFEAEPARAGHRVRMGLNISDFTRRLERYIFGKTGILLDLEYRDSGTGRDATFRVPGTPYDRAQVKYVFLANVHGNTRLWQEALTHRGAVGGGRGVAIALADRPAWRTRIRAVLRDLGPSSSVWSGSAYCFTPAIFAAAEELERQVQAAGIAGTLAHGELPTATEYLSRTGAPTNSVLGNLRVHLGNYGQKASGEQRGKERESHHITQYLLVEYFHNGPTDAPEQDQDRMGFPLLRRNANAYGDDLHTGSGRVPLRFRNVQIDSLEQDRGGRMPTILLARPTHRRGNLHINPHADDFDTASVSTQAAALNHIYKNHLSAEQRVLEREVFDGTRPYSAWEDYKRTHDISTPIYDAMQETYRFMRTYMQRQLRTALVGIERGYYNDMFAAANPTSTTEPISVDDMNRLANDAIRHNNDGASARGIAGMQTSGWIE